MRRNARADTHRSNALIQRYRRMRGQRDARDPRTAWRLRADRGLAAGARLLRTGRRGSRRGPLPRVRALADDPSHDRGRCRRSRAPSRSRRVVVRPEHYQRHRGNETGRRAGRTTWSESDYRHAIDEVRRAIGRGDVYQVNLVQHLSAPFSGDTGRRSPPGSASDRPRAGRDRSGWRLLGEGWAIVSASPELFLARRGDRVWTRPIKGTSARAGGAAELPRRRRTPPST